jgi:hypothetical protein
MVLDLQSNNIHILDLPYNNRELRQSREVTIIFDLQRKNIHVLDLQRNN